MPYNPSPNTKYTDHSHPLFQVLRQMAAYGQQPTREEYEAIPGYSSHSVAIREVVRRCQELHRSGEHGRADALATEKLHEIGPRLDGYTWPEPTTTPDSSDDIAARMFTTGH